MVGFWLRLCVAGGDGLVHGDCEIFFGDGSEALTFVIHGRSGSEADAQTRGSMPRTTSVAAVQKIHCQAGKSRSVFSCAAAVLIDVTEWILGRVLNPCMAFEAVIQRL